MEYQPNTTTTMASSSSSTTNNTTTTTNVDSLITTWRDLNLSGVESDEICINGETDYGMISTNGFPSLVGKLVTSKTYNKPAMFSYLKSSWDLNGWVRFKEVLGDVILIQFEKSEEKLKIMEKGPWIFRKSYFLVENIEGQVSHKQIQLNTIPLWVQIFGLPIMGYTVSLGQKVASKLGKVLAIDATRKISWKSGLRGHGYMRAKILMNIHTCLPRGTSIVDEEGSKVVLGFRYERLQNFCFLYGTIGHVMTECVRKDTGKDNGPQYGDWLRAASDFPHPFLTKVDSGVKADMSVIVGGKEQVAGSSEFEEHPTAAMEEDGGTTVVGKLSGICNLQEGLLTAPTDKNVPSGGSYDTSAINLDKGVGQNAWRNQFQIVGSCLGGGSFFHNWNVGFDPYPLQFGSGFQRIFKNTMIHSFQT